MIFFEILRRNLCILMNFGPPEDGLFSSGGITVTTTTTTTTKTIYKSAISRIKTRIRALRWH